MQSLSALGNCISALTESTRSHIPYRDSKLTRLLQDSLGGNTFTTVIATLSPIAANAEDTLSTLHFADRARHVTTKIKVNEMVDDGILLARAMKTIAKLKKQLAEQESERYRVRRVLCACTWGLCVAVSGSLCAPGLAALSAE